MTKVCSWCRGQMVVPIRRAAPAEPDAKVTYGMCRRCLEAGLAALVPRRHRNAAAR